MSPAEMLDALAVRGFRFEVCGDRLAVEPIPEAAIVAELRPVKAELLSYVAEHGGRWPIPPASEHRYVLWRGALADREGSVCLSCGTPPLLHGAGALADPLVLDTPEDAPLLQARGVVAAEVAETVAGLSPGGRLCVRCQRIARVYPNGICAFCADEAPQ